MAIDLVVYGADGRMGRRVVALAWEDPRFNLVGAIDREDSSNIGKDVGIIAQVGEIGLLLQSDFNLQTQQVVIDFSSPQSLENLLPKAISSGTSIVSGTTGLSDNQLESLKEASKHSAILHSPNMSVGVNLLLLLAAQMTRLAGDDFEVEIFEAHHRFKKDAPSGTALKLGEVIAKARDQKLADIAKYDRTQSNVARKREEIGIQSMRAGDIVGEHTAFFSTEGERIELTHRATSRDIFVRGALKAAYWLSQQTVGFYSMSDFLGF